MKHRERSRCTGGSGRSKAMRTSSTSSPYTTILLLKTGITNYLHFGSFSKIYGKHQWLCTSGTEDRDRVRYPVQWFKSPVVLLFLKLSMWFAQQTFKNGFPERIFLETSASDSLRAKNSYYEPYFLIDGNNHASRHFGLLCAKKKHKNSFKSIFSCFGIFLPTLYAQSVPKLSGDDFPRP